MRAFVLHQLESAINAYLHLDEDTIKRLASLQNKIILLIIDDWNIRLYLIPTQNGLELHRTLKEKPTSTIQGTLEALIHLSLNSSNSMLLKNKVEISGELDTAEKIRDILANIDIDWEEHLSRLTGDILAHKFTTTVRDLNDFSKKSWDAFILNLAEFLQHEINILPSRDEITQFIHDVSTIRNDVDRLTARLDLLIQQEQGTNPS